MVNEFKIWLKDNAAVYDALEEALLSVKRGKKVLAVGPFSLVAAAVLDENLGGNVEVMCDNLEFINDFRTSIDPEGRIPVRRGVEGTFDFVFAPMYINHITKDRLVSCLFDVYDSLEKGGLFTFSFQDSLKVDLDEGKEMPLWCSHTEKLFTKYYTMQDVLNTLITIGFRIKNISEVEGEGIIHAVCFECIKL